MRYFSIYLIRSIEQIKLFYAKQQIDKYWRVLYMTATAATESVTSGRLEHN